MLTLFLDGKPVFCYFLANHIKKSSHKSHFKEAFSIKQTPVINQISIERSRFKINKKST